MNLFKLFIITNFMKNAPWVLPLKDRLTLLFGANRCGGLVDCKFEPLLINQYAMPKAFKKNNVSKAHLHVS